MVSAPPVDGGPSAPVMHAADRDLAKGVRLSTDRHPWVTSPATYPDSGGPIMYRAIDHLQAATPAILAVNDLPTVIDRSTAWLVGILAAVATLFLTIGGVRYVLAGGDPGGGEKAKSAFRSAIIGYALAALAPIVVQIVSGILFGK